MHHRLALGAETSEQDRSLDLGAGDWKSIFDGPEVAAGDRDGRETPRTVADNASAHQPERVGDAVHRAGGDGLVASQRHRPREGSEVAGQQPDGRPRVADVERPVWLTETVETSGDVLPVDDRTELSDDVPRPSDVVAAREPTNGRRSLSACGQHEGPVRNGLVAGRTNATPQCCAAIDQELHDGPNALTDGRNPRASSAPRSRSAAFTSTTSTSTPPGALGGVGDLEVVDVDAELTGEGGDLGQHARPVGHRHPHLDEVLGPGALASAG